MFITDQLYQDDERWKDVKLGNSNETIGGWGGLARICNDATK